MENKFILMLGLMGIGFYPLLLFVKKAIVPRLQTIIEDKYQNYKNVFRKHKLSKRLVLIFVAIYLLFWNGLFDKAEITNELVIEVKNIIFSVLFVIIISTTAIAFIDTAINIYKVREWPKKIPVDLYAHVIKIFITACSVLTVISIAVGIPISTLFASIGAATAILTLIFKDTLLGLFASLQITFQNIIQVDDWVTIPKYNTDGRIEKITITVVTIRNPDQTSTTVPTSVFLTTDVKNRRTMIEKGGRRIKRPIIIDIDTIKICNQPTLDKFEKLPQMQPIVKHHKSLFKAENRISNLTIFRHFIDQYLKTHKQIHQEGFLSFVRQLEPSSYGLPLEIYAFTKAIDIVNYELIQTEIFEFLLAILPEFELKAFQINS